MIGKNNINLTTLILSSISILLFIIFAFICYLEALIVSIKKDKIQKKISEADANSSLINLKKLLTMNLPLTIPFNILLNILIILLTGTIIAIFTINSNKLLYLIPIYSLSILIFLNFLKLIINFKINPNSDAEHLKSLIILSKLEYIFNPIILLKYKSNNNKYINDSNSTPEFISTEIDLPVEASTEPLDEREVQMIHAVVRLDTTVAREIMIPRVDIKCAPSGITIEKIAKQMTNDSHSRIPIYKEDLDHIIGIVYARDILKIISETPDKASNQVDSLLRPAYFIPESKTLEELLTEFQNQRVQLAIVVDEYGGVSGLVTIEDLLEEIVGEIQDEFDPIEPEILSPSKNEFIIDARTSLEQLNNLLNTSFAGEGFDTVGGLVYSQMGKIPSSGSKINYKGIDIEVISTIGRRLKNLKISLSQINN
ncbi:MAG: hypothetical protein CL758_05235 [Chloroflexi bacterium]|nr:hypothetical protein [Chloroflexota bacterium]